MGFKQKKKKKKKNSGTFENLAVAVRHSRPWCRQAYLVYSPSAAAVRQRRPGARAPSTTFGIWP